MTNQSSVSSERVLVLDFGSQYAQLIARRVREQHVYCEIVRHDISSEQIRKHDPRGLILSGGPASVYEDESPQCDPRLFHMGLPVLPQDSSCQHAVTNALVDSDGALFARFPSDTSLPHV